MEVINQSFTEVIDIVNHMEKNMKIKIPKGFQKMLEDNMDTTYQVSIDYSKSINEQKLLKETRIILSLIYRDYICTPQEKAKILENDKMELQEQEEALRKKYEIDFNKKQSNIQNNYTTMDLAVIPNKKWYNDIIQKIKNIFKILKKES